MLILRQEMSLQKINNRKILQKAQFHYVVKIATILRRKESFAIRAFYFSLSFSSAHHTLFFRLPLRAPVIVERKERIFISPFWRRWDANTSDTLVCLPFFYLYYLFESVRQITDARGLLAYICIPACSGLHAFLYTVQCAHTMHVYTSFRIRYVQCK